MSFIQHSNSFRKFVDIRFLPSIVPEQQREAVTKLIAPEIESRIDRLKGLIDAGVIEQDSFHNGMFPTGSSEPSYVEREEFR